MSWVESELATVYRVGRRRYFSLDNAYIRQAKDLMLDAFSDGEGCQCYMDEVCEYHALLGVPGEAGIGASAVVLARSPRPLCWRGRCAPPMRGGSHLLSRNGPKPSSAIARILVARIRRRRR